MSTTVLDGTEQRDLFAQRLMSDMVASMETLGIWLGLQLGLYEAIDRAGTCTAAELASAAAIDRRYAREWLEQQAVAGVLVTTEPCRDAEDRRYELPPPHREVLLDEVSPYYVAPVSSALAGIGRVLPELLAAYRTGAGVQYAAYGQEIRDYIEKANRPMYVNDLAAYWIPAVPQLHARLRAHPPARVADIACGAGWSSIALAQGYPDVRVDGFDLDGESIRRAERNAAAAGVADRVSVAVRDATDPELAGRYDAAMMFEALHDMAKPVAALAAARRLLAPGGCMIIGDEKAAETFTAPGDELERLLYGCSIPHCLPVGRTETPSAATGTVLRPATLRDYARQAGFTRVDVLPIENDLWRFYLLQP